MKKQVLNKLRSSCLRLGLIVLTTFYCLSTLAQDSFFRYTNDQGIKVITDSISPADAIRGYQIIDSKGNVLKVVPAELSEEEKKQRDRDEEHQRQQEKYDKELLSRYSSVNDIEATKERRIQEIDNSIRSLYLTLNNISETIKSYQAEAASNERQGEVIPQDTLMTIKKLQQDRAFIEQEIVNKENQKKSVAASYNKDIKRFSVIKPK